MSGHDCQLVICAGLLRVLDLTPQASGQLVYTDDLPLRRDSAFGAFVHATVAAGTLTSINAAPALTQPGVLGFVSAKDCVHRICQEGGPFGVQVCHPTATIDIWLSRPLNMATCPSQQGCRDCLDKSAVRQWHLCIRRACFAIQVTGGGELTSHVVHRTRRCLPLRMLATMASRWASWSRTPRPLHVLPQQWSKCAPLSPPISSPPLHGGLTPLPHCLALFCCYIGSVIVSSKRTLTRNVDDNLQE